MAGNGNLNLTGESFEKLKKLIDDLTDSANKAREAIAGIFNSKNMANDWSKSLKKAVQALDGISKKTSSSASGSDKSKEKIEAANAAAKLIKQASQVDAKLKLAAAKAAAKVTAQTASASAKATKQAAAISTKATKQAASASARLTKQSANASAKITTQAASLAAKVAAKITTQAANLSAKATKQAASASGKATKQSASASARLTKQSANVYARIRTQAATQQVAQARAAAKITTQAANASARLTTQAANATARMTTLAAKTRAAQVIAAAKASNAAARTATAAGAKKTPFNNLLQAASMKNRIRTASSMFFNGNNGGQSNINYRAKGGNFANAGGNIFSRFGSAGALGGVLGKFRAFQKPFPGSERNQFALGDSTAIFNNILHGTGTSVKNAFKGITLAASSTAKGLASIPVGITSLFHPVAGALLSTVNDAFFGIFDMLSAAISGVIGSLTNLSTALLGFASRAVESASKFTESVNAAKVVTGVDTGNKLKATAIQLQRDYGLSAIDSMRGMGRIAGMLVQQGGFTQKEAGIQSEEIARQLADVASVNNRNIEDLMRDMMSGLAGRFTPMRKNMMGFQAPVLDIMAKNKGIANPGLRTDLVARTKMFIEEFTRQAGLFAGDLENTRFEFANQRRKFLGGFEALFMSVGQILEPFGKVILFASNDLMDQLLAIIQPFAENPFQGFKNQIESFTKYMAKSKAVIIAFAESIWKSRDTILEVLKGFTLVAFDIFRAISNITISIMQGFFTITDSFGGIVASSQLLVSAFGILEEVLLQLPKALISLGLVKLKLLGPVGGAAAFAAMNIRWNGKKEEKQGEGLKGFNKLVDQAAKGLEAVEMDINDQLDWFKNAAPAAAKAGNVAPQNPLSMAGRMVQYFDPASFRDAVQEREMGVQTRIANAAEKILMVLEKPDPLHPKIAGPMAVPIGLGAMGVLEGMKRVAKP